MGNALHAVLNPEALAVIEPLLAQGGAGRPVCFDADGTLWRGDVGEELLRFLIAEDRLPRHRGEKALYAEYERRHAAEPISAYCFNVEVLAGLEQQTLAGWSAAFFETRFVPQLFPFTRPLLHAFAAAGFRIVIVSASPRWVVEAGARALGVSEVIAADCELDAGVLTTRVLRPLPAGQGKVEQLKRRGVVPAFAAGNGDLDLPMLEYAPARLVVAPLGDQSNQLVHAAQLKGWPVQRA